MQVAEIASAEPEEVWRLRKGEWRPVADIEQLRWTVGMKGVGMSRVQVHIKHK